MPGALSEFDLYDLLSACCDGALTAEQTSRLQGVLLGDLRARALYVDFMLMHNGARYMVGSQPYPALLDDPNGGGGFAPPGDAVEPAKKPDRFSLRAVRLAMGNNRWTTSLCIALLFVASMLLGLSIMRYGPRDPGRDALPSDSGALADAADGRNERLQKKLPRVVSAHRCALEGKRRLVSGERLAWGTTLHLREGVLCVEYPCGARIIAEAETHFTLADAASTRLKLGRLSVQVPSQAGGFAVATPTMRIVDIGTEFGAYVDAQGNSEVHVFAGLVELHPPHAEDASPRAAPKVAVGEGMGWRVEASEAAAKSESEADAASEPLASFGRAIEPRARDFIRRVPAEGTFARGAPSADSIRTIEPALWLDATHAEGIETQGEGNEVALWRDLSGRGRHAAPDPRSFAPHAALIRQRGEPCRVLQFGEESAHAEPKQALSVDWIPPRGDYTGFVVAATREDRAAFLAQDAPGFGNLDASFGVGIQNAYRNRPAENLPAIAPGALTFETHGPASGSGSSGASLESPRANDGRLRIFSFRVRGARYEVGNNGRLQTNEALQAGAFGGNGKQPLVIGARQPFVGNWPLYLRGQIAEIVIFARALDDGDFHRVGRELGAKYGIASEFASEE